jgi:serine/threonine-protein kinase
MSPEQVLGQPVDGRSDLYSLGCLLYELSTGKWPFGGENLAAIFKGVTQDTPVEPVRLNSAISRGLSRIIMKCLSKAPDERFPTGLVLAKALESCLEDGEFVLPTVRPARKVSKSLRLMFSIILLAAAIIGGFTYYLTTRRGVDVSSPPAKVEVGRQALLKVESEPVGAQVYVDGGFKGETPLRLELSLGKHEVRLNLPDYYDWEAQVDLKEEGETPLIVELIPTEEKN